jgi:FlaA1/EpsC-like NDP-sugar epimerase
VVLDQSAFNRYITGKTVLVTGAGGSIGSEICRQIAKFNPERLLLLGHGENSIYLIHRELINRYGDRIEILPLIADIQDRELMFDIMKEYRPDLVYHAAAHKHVPLMEANPKESVKNNIFGTKDVAEAAKAAGVTKFVMVSTDKAVNPPNVMGATKRVAEMIVTGLNEEEKTQFVAVRFGNVLGSRGSVVPVFKDQIAKGGPLTVTDYRMTRYFMTIPEASRLVIQAGYLALGGEIFVLDMGDPVRIVDLAEKVIKLSGHTVAEIGIVESGIRPGEKLYEELMSTSERVSKKIHDKIFIGKVEPKSMAEVEDFIKDLLVLDNQTLKERLIAYAKQE